QYGPGGVAVDRDLTIRIDQLRTVAVEEGADPLDRIAGGAERHAERIAGLEAFRGGLREEIPGPSRLQLNVRWCPRRVHLGHLEPDDLFHQIDPSAWRRQSAPERGWYCDPMTVLPPEIFSTCADGTVLPDQLRHDVVDRIEVLGLPRRIPGGEGQDVVAGLRLRLGRDGQQVLVAVGSDKVGLQLDLLLLCPFAAELFEGFVGAG